MTDGYIYCFSNPSMPGILKIGMTERSPEIRLKEANKADTWKPPTPYKIELTKKVINPKQKETTLHSLLSKYANRTNDKREFFQISIQEIKIFFDLIDGDLLINDKEEIEIKEELKEEVKSKTETRQKLKNKAKELQERAEKVAKKRTERRNRTKKELEQEELKEKELKQEELKEKELKQEELKQEELKKEVKEKIKQQIEVKEIEKVKQQIEVKEIEKVKQQIEVKKIEKVKQQIEVKEIEKVKQQIEVKKIEKVKQQIEVKNNRIKNFNNSYGIIYLILLIINLFIVVIYNLKTLPANS
jgi:hypothetical protein